MSETELSIMVHAACKIKNKVQHKHLVDEGVEETALSTIAVLHWLEADHLCGCVDGPSGQPNDVRRTISNLVLRTFGAADQIRYDTST